MDGADRRTGDYMTGHIYMIKSIETEKRYIGLTRRTIQERYTEHMRKAFDENSSTYKTPLSVAIRNSDSIESWKYGVLAEDVPDEELELVEAHYIDLFNTTDPEIGLNLSPRANVTNGYTTEDLKPDDNLETKKLIKIDGIEDSAVAELLNNWRD